MISLARYSVTALIHDSEDHAIYSGLRLADATPVAIKVLPHEHPSPAEIAKLRHEHALLQELEIPGVVRAYALEHGSFGPALILERLTGSSLADVLDDGPLELEMALSVASALAATLGAIHLRHVIHKDVSPHNIVIDLDEPRVTLVDFGIATRLSQEAARVFGPAGLEGSLAYMSPEQTGRMNRAVDARADLYSLGVTMYEMLTGLLPFPETDPMELVHSHIARTPPWPGDLSSTIPPAVSSVVMKLLAKAAEDRYQSAFGLKDDLDECLAQLAAKGRIDPFPLGRRDLAGELRIPQKLYGRDAELAAIATAFERVSLGAAELVLVKGPAGVGKSALVNELHPEVARRGGAFGAGKCEGPGHGLPYAPVAEALRQIVRQILAGSPESLAGYKRRFLAALGQNGRLIVDLIPELELCLGPQPEVPALGPAEAKQRFRLSFQGFIRAFTSETTLVLFLDDLHWADPASLSLVHLLLTDPDRAQILVVGAYRDNEVKPSDPLLHAIAELRGAGAAVSEIELAPLALEQINELLADALATDSPEVSELAFVAFEKTHGNPFFLSRFLHACSREGMLSVDAGRRVFTWDIERIKEATITSNVVDFLLDKIKELSPRTQRALALAACVGHAFDQRTLSVAFEASMDAAARDLWEALEEGLVVPLDPGYRFFDAKESAAEAPDTEALNVHYRFSHDRVLQAAYRLIDEDHRQEAHLRIGNLLAAKLEHEPEGAALLDVVTHLNLGAARMTDPEQRVKLARWNLKAGKQVKAIYAIEAAAGYFAAGAALLDEAAWEAEYPLAFALHMEQAECEHHRGRLDEAMARYDALFARAATDVDRASVEAARVTLYVALGRYDTAVATGREGLRHLGAPLPEAEADIDVAVAAELCELPKNLGDRRIEDLISAPVIADPRQRAIQKLLTELWVPAHLVMPKLRTLIVRKQVNLSLSHGHSELSAFGYMAYGSSLARTDERYEEAQAFCRLALALNERFNNANLTANLHFMFGVCAHLFEPIEAAVTALVRAQRVGLATGDLSRAAFATAFIPPLRMSMDVGLAAVEEEIDGYLAIVRRRAWDELAILGLTLSKQMIAALTGRTEEPTSLQGVGFDEASFMAATAKAGLEYTACWYYAIKAELAFLHGDYAGAVTMAALAETKIESTRGTFRMTELCMSSFLSLAALRPDVPAEDEKRIEATLDGQLAQMARWAEHCPANFRHKDMLMRAERARLDEHYDAAMELYDEAIDAAREGHFMKDAGIAGEFAARFYLGRGRLRTARAYLSDARYAFLRWGASAIGATLDVRYADLLTQSEPVSRAAGGRGRGPESAAGRREVSLDVTAVLRAAQAIAAEIELENVLERLLRITLSNAGAQRGALLLGQQGQLWVEATITLAPDEVRLGPPLMLEDAGDLVPASIVQFVERTREVVVLSDAAREARWISDPYVAAASPRSVLCLAMVVKGQLVGVLYLENNAVRGAFTKARIEVCRLLSSQAAIAVENALLYTRVKAVSEQLQRTNAALEGEVLRRTEELRTELAERTRSEEAREALQAEIIKVQRERLAELSTPLIPILPRVMVMPLIGTIDAERATQVLEAALTGASANRAKVVILDITGVKHVDAEVAETLVRTAGALALLGCEAVVTGIRPDVAQTLVGLGLGLSAMVTRGTLASGVAYALTRTGARLV